MSCLEAAFVIVTMTYARLRAAQRFFRTFLEGREDREVRVSDWRRHPAVGRLREVSFVSAVKRTMGISPPFAHCHQTQRYRWEPSPAVPLAALAVVYSLRRPDVWDHLRIVSSHEAHHGRRPALCALPSDNALQVVLRSCRASLQYSNKSFFENNSTLMSR